MTSIVINILLQEGKHRCKYTVPLQYIQSKFLSSCNSIKPFDFSTIYTTIPHYKLNDRLKELVQLCFIKT